LPNDSPITKEEIDKLNINTINFQIFSKQDRQTIRLVTYALIIKILLNLHREEEKTKLIQKMIQDFNKIFKKRIKTEKELYIISSLLSEKIWEDAVQVFKGKSFKIELSNLILCIWMFEEKRLQKQFLFSNKKIEKISQPLQADDAFTIETNNRKLADYINKELHNYLDLELPQKHSFLKN